MGLISGKRSSGIHENKLCIIQNKGLTDVMLTAGGDEGSLTEVVFNREMTTKVKK